MSTPRILTAHDAIDFATHVMSSQGISANLGSMQWALANAYNEIGQEFGWSFLQTHGRLFLHASQTTGTASYDHVGGAYSRLVTLVGATFPDWAVDASIRLDGVVCRIEEIKTSTTAVLHPVLNPGRDVAEGSSYRIYPSYYALPNDFQTLVTPRAESPDWSMSEMSYDDIMALDRDNDETGTPSYYCVRGVEDLYGQMGLFVHPDSDADKTIDFIYQRLPREVRYTGSAAAESAGTISITQGSAAVAGSGTSWSALMVGAIFRIGSSLTTAPTGLRGAEPFVEERSIAAINNGTLLTLDGNVTTSRSGVKYRVSDPIDLDPSLYSVFLWGVARQLAIECNYDGAARIEQQYAKALDDAKAANNRSTSRIYAGQGATVPRRLADTTPILGDS